MGKQLIERFYIYFVSLGCSRALVDSEVMIGLLMKKGYHLTKNIWDADFIIVNTCGFLQEARDEAVAMLEEVFEKKQITARVIATGCMVQKHQHILKEKFPLMHFYLGSGDVDKIIQAVEAVDHGQIISDKKSFLERKDEERFISTPKPYAYVKIAEGCRKSCSYCIIPMIKGRLKSKPVEQIIDEIKSLLSRGIQEIILIAQDLTDYGKDRYEKEALENLLEDILMIKKDFWIRLMYVYPDGISDRLINIMKNDDRICPYIDMPIQHISDRILKLMKRRLTKKEIIQTINKLRKEIPHMTIRTSLMVGFPSESEKDFSELTQFIKDYPLDHIGIFAFSKEKEAHAANLKGQIDNKTKQKRKNFLASIQKKMVEKANRRLIGKKLKALVEGYHSDSNLLMQARHAGQCPDIDNIIIINDARHVKAFGKQYSVKVTDSVGYDLVGSVVK